MSILDLLQQEVPKRKPLSLLSPQYQLVKRYMPDIAEAKERGYSWNQIERAVENDAAEKGEWNTEWDRWRVEALFNQIKREQQSA
jgi:hypothetical protein